MNLTVEQLSVMVVILKLTFAKRLETGAHNLLRGTSATTGGMRWQRCERLVRVFRQLESDVSNYSYSVDKTKTIPRVRCKQLKSAIFGL